MENKKAVFFDLDGTLFDNEQLWKESYAEVLREHLGYLPNAFETLYEFGQNTRKQWEALIINSELRDSGVSIEELANKTFSNYMKKVDSMEDIEPREGFFDLMFVLKDKELKMGLVTGVERDIAVKVTQKMHINNLFDLIVTGDETQKKKPDPQIYLYAAKKLGLKPKEILVFEDSVSGVTAATKAGMDVIVMWNGETPHTKYPDTVWGFALNFNGVADSLEISTEDIVKGFFTKLKESTPKQETGKSPVPSE